MDSWLTSGTNDKRKGGCSIVITSASLAHNQFRMSSRNEICTSEWREYFDMIIAVDTDNRHTLIYNTNNALRCQQIPMHTLQANILKFIAFQGSRLGDDFVYSTHAQSHTNVFKHDFKLYLNLDLCLRTYAVHSRTYMVCLCTMTDWLTDWLTRWNWMTNFLTELRWIHFCG